MRPDDFERFEQLIRKLESIYGKRIDDAAMQTWWRALRDLPYELLAQRVESHIRYAKFFPKPGELRPREDRPKETDQTAERKFKAAQAENMANWKRRLKEDELEMKWALLDAYLARIDMQYQRDSSEYAEKMDFARGAYHRLIERSSDEYLIQQPHRLRIIGQLEPPERYLDLSARMARLRTEAAVARSISPRGAPIPK